MSTHRSSLPSESRVKQRAKQLKVLHGITHSEALKTLSEEYGFTDWASFRNEIRKLHHAGNKLLNGDQQ